jgi:hypothetical protein
MDAIWIRRDRADGKEEEISKQEAKARLVHHYNGVDSAMVYASVKAPLTTGFADYFPKPFCTIYQTEAQAKAGCECHCPVDPNRGNSNTFYRCQYGPCAGYHCPDCGKFQRVGGY